MGHIIGYGLWSTWAAFSIIITWILLQQLQQLGVFKSLIIIVITIGIAMVVYQNVPQDNPLSNRPNQEIALALITFYPLLTSAILLFNTRISITPEKRPQPPESEE